MFKVHCHFWLFILYSWVGIFKLQIYIVIKVAKIEIVDLLELIELNKIIKNSATCIENWN